MQYMRDATAGKGGEAIMEVIGRCTATGGEGPDEMNTGCAVQEDGGRGNRGRIADGGPETA